MKSIKSRGVWNWPFSWLQSSILRLEGGVSLVFLSDWGSVPWFLCLASPILLVFCESARLDSILSPLAVPGCRLPWLLVRLFLSHPALWEIHRRDCYSHCGAFEVEVGAPSGWVQPCSRVWLMQAVRMAFQPPLLSWPGSLVFVFLIEWQSL